MGESDMVIDGEAFVEQVQKLYVWNPCQVSCIAFWKIERICLESETYRIVENGHTYLYAIRNQRLEFYWSDDRDRFILPQDRIQALELLVLHDDFYKLIARDIKGYKAEKICPLIYDSACGQGSIHSKDYYVADFDFDSKQEYAVAAELLNRCYPDHIHDAEEIAEWCKQPVFNDALWLWVKAKAGNERIGLGISTYQSSIKETYLDWIQVLPMYQRRGIGKMLVGETVNRAIEVSNIIRVTGKVDGFYEKCGFAGTENWHVIRKL